jgi:3-phosphoshikimate 1-carboxyvinyltransferase
MGASLQAAVTQEAGEPWGTLTVEGRGLRAVTLEPWEVPGLIDELPVLMTAAACARGTSRFTGVGELRVKETDRIRSMVEGLTALGARIRTPGPETVEIDGGPLRGGVVESAGDHRTAMSLAVAGLLAQGTTVIRGAECVAKSFPGFFEALGRLAGFPTGKTVDKP